MKSSHISKVWYWEGIYYLLQGTNSRMQFWCSSVFPCLIPLPYISVCLCESIKKKKKKRYSVLSSCSALVIYDIEKGFITSAMTLTVACRFGVVLWVYSLVSPRFPYIICLCVCLAKKKRKVRYSALLSCPTSVMCDIEKGVFTCNVTLYDTRSFVVGVWVYFLVSSPFPFMCVCLTKKLKKDTQCRQVIPHQ